MRPGNRRRRQPSPWRSCVLPGKFAHRLFELLIGRHDPRAGVLATHVDSAHARDVVSGQTLDNFIAALATVLSDGLTRAEQELGRNLDLPALPAILNQLVAAWLRGGGVPLNPTSAAFDQLFTRSVIRT